MQLNDTAQLNGILQDIYFNGHITALTYQPNDLLRIINKYYFQAQSDIRAINEDFFGQISTTNLVVNTGGTYPNEYPLPTDYEKIKQIQVAYSPANPLAPQPGEFQVANIITQDQISDPTYVDFDNCYAILYDASFFLQPIPSVAVTGGIILYYIQQQTPLANATDTPNIFTDYQDVITWGSLIDVAIRKGDQTLLKNATAMYAQRRTEMKAYASSRSLALSSKYVEGQDGESGWEFPFGSNSMS